jgi:hypothetical protein
MRHVRRSRARLATLATLTGVLLAATGCGDDSEPTGDAEEPTSTTSSSADDPSDEASETPEDEDDGEVAAPAAGKDVSVDDFIALVQQALELGDSARIGLTQTASGLSATGEVSYADPVAMSMEMTIPAMGAEPVEARIVDNVMYMKLAMLGDKFIKFDLADPNNPLGEGFVDLIDPSNLADLISSSVETITFVGEEDVDGEAMDRYDVVQDAQAVVDQLDLPETGPAPDLPETVLLSYWFDEDGFLRQAVTDMGELGTSTNTFDDWGIEVDVQAPAADQIMEMPAMPSMPAQGMG